MRSIETPPEKPSATRHSALRRRAAIGSARLIADPIDDYQARLRNRDPPVLCILELGHVLGKPDRGAFRPPKLKVTSLLSFLLFWSRAGCLLLSPYGVIDSVVSPPSRARRAPVI
jgi:hypothetical protein